MWIIVSFVIAIVSRDQFQRKKYLLIAFSLLIFFSNSFLFSFLVHAWEIPPTNYTGDEVYDAAIVLGGVTHYDAEHNRMQFLRGADRLFQAIDLYKMKKANKILFTGGSGELLHPEYKEGALIKEYVMKLGIPSSDFIIENESRNTHENAMFTKQLLIKEKITGKLLLITSAFHMRRSLACFNKVGVFPTPYSTDVYGKPIKRAKEQDWSSLIIPSIEPMVDWTNFIHELVGYCIYKIVGYA
jgi:uncharacterized SAM-binding protein YcdF (DUF218 family)